MKASGCGLQASGDFENSASRLKACRLTPAA